MAYFAPYIDKDGFHVPTFLDVQAELVSRARSIFGADIYLDNDSQDAQWIAAVSRSLYDTMLLAQLVYSGQSPQTAVGVGLDNIVKINGLRRHAASYSTCLVTCVGIPGTIIPAGIVRDISGYNWTLPPNSVIGDEGSLSVYVTCETPGAIVADIGAIQTIATPQYGWTTVSNVAAASPGAAYEADTALRNRQALSVALPATTPLGTITAAVLEVQGVTRIKAYENNTNAADANGIPAHNVSMVVEGGTDLDVANAIYLKKTPGVPTFGTTSVVTTTDNRTFTEINFFRPTAVPIDVAITVKALSGYTEAITNQIIKQVVEHLSQYAIGDDVYMSSLWGAALEAIPDAKSPAFSITSLTAAEHGGTQGASDIVIAFNEVAHGNIEFVNVTVV